MSQRTLLNMYQQNAETIIETLLPSKLGREEFTFLLMRTTLCHVIKYSPSDVQSSQEHEFHNYSNFGKSTSFSQTSALIMHFREKKKSWGNNINSSRTIHFNPLSFQVCKSHHKLMLRLYEQTQPWTHIRIVHERAMHVLVNRWILYLAVFSSMCFCWNTKRISCMSIHFLASEVFFSFLWKWINTKVLDIVLHSHM